MPIFSRVSSRGERPVQALSSAGLEFKLPLLESSPSLSVSSPVPFKSRVVTSSLERVGKGKAEERVSMGRFGVAGSMLPSWMTAGVPSAFATKGNANLEAAGCVGSLAATQRAEPTGAAPPSCFPPCPRADAPRPDRCVRFDCGPGRHLVRDAPLARLEGRTGRSPAPEQLLLLVLLLALPLAPSPTPAPTTSAARVNTSTPLRATARRTAPGCRRSVLVSLWRHLRGCTGLWLEGRLCTSRSRSRRSRPSSSTATSSQLQSRAGPGVRRARLKKMVHELIWTHSKGRAPPRQRPRPKPLQRRLLPPRSSPPSPPIRRISPPLPPLMDRGRRRYGMEHRPDRARKEAGGCGRRGRAGLGRVVDSCFVSNSLRKVLGRC